MATGAVSRWAVHVERMEDRKGACRVLVDGSVGWRPLGRRRPSWENNIKMDIGKVVWLGIDWLWLRIVTGGRLL